MIIRHDIRTSFIPAQTRNFFQRWRPQTIAEAIGTPVDARAWYLLWTQRPENMALGVELAEAGESNRKDLAAAQATNSWAGMGATSSYCVIQVCDFPMNTAARTRSCRVLAATDSIECCDEVEQCPP